MLEAKSAMRRVPAGASPCAWPTEDLFMDWANLIRAEYGEMPGLSLTEKQVERLWQLDQPMAKALLKHLIDEGFLHCTPKGAFIRADGGFC
jgi:Spy/CpxP family protein refolding chaperone